MRPLAIWAMQWALSKEKVSKDDESEKSYINEEEIVSRCHAGFSKVARLLKWKEESGSRSVFQVIYDLTCKRYV